MASNQHILESIGVLSLVFDHLSSIRDCLHFWYLVSHVIRTQKPYKLTQLTSFSNETKAKGWSAFGCKICSMDLLEFMLFKKLWRHKNFDVIAFSVTRISTYLYYRFCFWLHSTLWRKMLPVWVYTVFVFWSRDLPNMLITTKTEGNL